MKKMSSILISMSIVSLLCCSGCLSTRTGQGAAVGAGLGAGLGAIAGQIIGGGSESTALGAGIGAGIGSLLGAGVGQILDRQQAEMNQQLDSRDVRIQRLQDEQLKIDFSGDVLFTQGSSQLNPQARSTLRTFAGIFNSYPKTKMVLTGHTDNRGHHLYNQKLSDQRAASVARLLMGYGVSPRRVEVRGAGEMAPLADNSKPSGRQQNRRVDVLIMPVNQPTPQVQYTVFQDTEPGGFARKATPQTPKEQEETEEKQDTATKIAEKNSQTQQPPEPKQPQRNIGSMRDYSPIRTGTELIKASRS